MRRALALALVLALGGWEPFRSADPDVEAGNRAYAEGRYDDALAAYDRAKRRGGVDADGLAFDRGTAELKKAEATKDAAEKQHLTERALEDLKQAAHAKDAHIRGAASYNRGNLLMEQDKLDDAIEAYKQALREQPDLHDARLNLELALRRRQKQQQRQSPQGQPGQRGQPRGQPDQPGQQGQGQPGQQGQGQGQPGQQGQGQGQPGQQGQGQPGQQGPQGGSNRSQSGGNGQGQGQSQNSTGSNPPQDGASGQGSNGQLPRGRPQRGRGPQSPKTPVDGKLDDLDTYSRRLQREEARRRATGRSSDPQHDW